ncbi:MAG: ROK family transcriptional regulator [Actinocatenispora sp.]
MSPAGPKRLAGSPSLLRAINERAVFEYLLEQGPLTRAGVAKLAGLSTPTASSALTRLHAQGLITPVGETSGRPGRNATLYTVQPAIALVAAVEVTPRSLTSVVCDVSGQVRARSRQVVPNGVGAADAVAGALDDVCQQAGLSPGALTRVQLAVPGSYDAANDAIRYVSHLPGWSRPGIVGGLRDRLHPTRVDVDNDVNLAAIAERSRGVAGHADWFALFWVSRGLGLAVDLGGSPLRGARGGAGEIGYMPVGLPGRGPAGHKLQSLVGAAAVRALASEHGLRGRTAGLVVRRAVDSGGTGRAFLRELAERIAVGLAAVIAVLDPPLVVLAGEVCQAGGTTLRDLIVRALVRSSGFDSPVVVTGVEGNPVLLGAIDAVVAGARAELVATLGERAGPSALPR